jgi:hypothetical protein
MYRKWRLRCPKCGGFYYAELIEHYDVNETCPFACDYDYELNCQVGYKAPFEDFIEYEVIPNGG